MQAINTGPVTELIAPETKVADLIRKYGKAIVWRSRPATRRSVEDKPMSVQQSMNARREAEYVARRNGQKEALIQIWEAR
ncbi:hypothetical protein DFO67_10449 [Modicisalibacter xianhensis]|uniref:Uncharacterized protein n=1 Tax=Modicisalibacter xianhensis TaxID=442341 RepID=A0A4R8FVF9_9GAMM|nr:hypothetical protein [Halomonas xianhensis]TDX30794.1 hypothetical protein DFO67_10449 [Halomonas xianhensis]